MKLLTIFRTLGPADLKNIRRDALLVWAPFLPLIMALSIRLMLPFIADLCRQRLGFDITPFYPWIMSGFITLIPCLVGMIVGFLLLDERDEQTLKALLVTPLPFTGYLLYRISVPILLGTLSTLVCYPLIGLTPLDFWKLGLIGLLASCSAPQLALFLVSFAENKVAGLAQLKLLNLILLLPMVAFFLPYPWQLIAGLLPPYWIVKTFWVASSGGGFWPWFGVGLFYNLLFIALLARKAQQIIHQQG